MLWKFDVPVHSGLLHIQHTGGLTKEDELTDWVEYKLVVPKH